MLHSTRFNSDTIKHKYASRNHGIKDDSIDNCDIFRPIT